MLVDIVWELELPVLILLYNQLYLQFSRHVPTIRTKRKQKKWRADQKFALSTKFPRNPVWIVNSKRGNRKRPQGQDTWHPKLIKKSNFSNPYRMRMRLLEKLRKTRNPIGLWKEPQKGSTEAHHCTLHNFTIQTPIRIEGALKMSISFPRMHLGGFLGPMGVNGGLLEFN